MSIIYDNKIFKTFRNLAITNISDLRVGRSYYSNYYDDFFLINSIIYEEKNSYKVEIIIKDKNDHFYSRDFNIGGSYNPWLVFDNKNVCYLCKCNLKITFERDYDEIDDEYYDSILDDDHFNEMEY
jgi:hypothetical protein